MLVGLVYKSDRALVGFVLRYPSVCKKTIFQNSQGSHLERRMMGHPKCY